MTVAWTDFLVIADVVNELYQTIKNFVDRGKNDIEVWNAAIKYRRCFRDPAFIDLIDDARRKVEGGLIDDFFRKYFGSGFEEKETGVLEGIKEEGEMYFKEEKHRGYSSMYCAMAWDGERVKNDADLDLFHLLFQIDLENGADATEILHNLCRIGAFGAMKRVDFQKIKFEKTDGTGGSIFVRLMQLLIQADKGGVPQLSRIVSETEEAFFFLVGKAEEKIGSEKLNRIIETPGDGGETLFSLASYLSEKIAGWILERDIDVAFVDARWRTAEFFFPNLVEKMVRKGINPFIVDYSGMPQSLKHWPKKLRKLEKQLKPFLLGPISAGKTAAFYSFLDSNCSPKCDENCGDKMIKFKLYTGSKKFMNEKSGGEGTVGFGKWHGQEAAFKKVELGKIEDASFVQDVISNAEKTRAEFEVASKLSHENIVKVLHLFRYQETEVTGNGRWTENWTVTVMEKHSKNIAELTEAERLEIKKLLGDSLEALIFISEKGLIHGDIKPGNISVSSRDGRLRAFVGDFGLTNKSGGTPIFMAPEGLRNESRVVEKTDLYSFAITTLFLLFRTDLALKLLFLPVSEGVERFRKTIHRFPLLALIFHCLTPGPEKRTNFYIWKTMLGLIGDFEESWLTGKISPEILEECGVDLQPVNLAQEREEEMVDSILQSFYRDTLQDIGSELVNEKKNWHMSQAVSHFRNLSLQTLNQTSNLLSKAVHEQGYENVCWVYATSTMIRSSVRSFLKNKSRESDQLSDEHHKTMRKQILMNVFPFGNDGTDTSLVLRALSFPTCLLEPGIRRLHSVSSVLGKFEFETQLFVHPKKIGEYENGTQFLAGSFRDALEKGKVLASNPTFGHAAALFKESEGNYLFKDSNGEKIFKRPVVSPPPESGWWIEFY